MKALVLLLLAIATNAHADNFRCGKWIASPDLTVTELLAKCGEPASREKRVENVLSRNYRTGGMYRSGERVIETWVYDRGSRAAPMVVTIVDGRIKAIERGR